MTFLAKLDVCYNMQNKRKISIIANYIFRQTALASAAAMCSLKIGSYFKLKKKCFAYDVPFKLELVCKLFSSK